MYDYNCPDCNEAKLQSDKNARKINDVIDQVNLIIDNQYATIEYLLDKADEIVGKEAKEKVNEEIGELIYKTDSVQQQVNNLVLGAVGDGNNAEVVQARGSHKVLYDRLDNNEYELKTLKDSLGTTIVDRGKNILFLKDQHFENNGLIVDI